LYSITIGFANVLIAKCTDLNVVSGGATRPLPRDRDLEELHGDPIVGHAPRSGLEVKNRSSAEDGATERLRNGTIQEEVS